MRSALDLARTQSTGSSSWNGFSVEASAFNAQQAELAREFARAEAQKNRDFQERMSNTQYQRAVKDMKRAGINPILRAQLGGAGTPSGSSAGSTSASAGSEGGSSTQMESIAEIIGGLMSSALSLYQNNIKDNLEINMYSSLQKLGLIKGNKGASSTGGGHATIKR